MIRALKNKKIAAALIWIAAIFLCFHCLPDKSANETQAHTAQAATPDKTELRVCFWNIKNYLDTYRYTGGMRTKGPKPESEKSSLADAIKQINPDILGIAEIGGIQYLNEFRKILTDAGMDYPFFAVSGNDPEHPQCAVISRVPILGFKVVGGKYFDYFGEMRSSPRGLLLVDLKSGGQRWHYGVLHLKSRFGSKKRDREFSVFRQNEVRAFLDDLKGIKKPIIIGGDFNDEIIDAAPQIFIKNSYVGLPFAAEFKNTPTYVWQKENKNYVFDFFIANAQMKKLAGEAKIFERINNASDHMPVFVDIAINCD